MYTQIIFRSDVVISRTVSCVQGWYYFTHQSDRWMIKIVVRVPPPSPYHCSLKTFQRSEAFWRATLSTRHSFRIRVGDLPCITTTYLSHISRSLLVFDHQLWKSCRAWRVGLVCMLHSHLSLSYHLHFVTLQEPLSKSADDQNHNFNSVFKQKVEVVFNVSHTPLEIAPRVNYIYHRA